MPDHLEVAEGGEVGGCPVLGAGREEGHRPGDHGRDEELVVGGAEAAIGVRVNGDVSGGRGRRELVGSAAEGPGRRGRLGVPEAGSGVKWGAGGFCFLEVRVRVALQLGFEVGGAFCRHFGVAVGGDATGFAGANCLGGCGICFSGCCDRDRGAWELPWWRKS